MENLPFFSLTVSQVEALVKSWVAEELIKLSPVPVNELPDRVSLEEAQIITGLKRSTIYRLTSAKNIPHSYFGRFLVFSRRELEKWVSDNTVDGKVINRKKLVNQ